MMFCLRLLHGLHSPAESYPRKVLALFTCVDDSAKALKSSDKRLLLLSPGDTAKMSP